MEQTNTTGGCDHQESVLLFLYSASYSTSDNFVVVTNSSAKEGPQLYASRKRHEINVCHIPNNCANNMKSLYRL